MKQKYLVERVMNAIFFACGLTAIAHFVPNRKSMKPIFPMAGTPARII